jgi:DNA polymerase elongation subunit (family B)
MYGALGVKEGYLPLMPAAMCVTSRGRESIKKASVFLESECGGTVIYNDTDSAYTYFKCLEGKSMKEVWEYAEGVVEKVKALFPPPMKLEFEGKCYTKFLILTKKRYVATMSDENGNISKKLLKRGLCITRRDNCKFLRDLYEKSIYYILDNADTFTNISVEMTQREIMNLYSVQGMLNMILDMISNLFQRQYGYKDFVITKGLTKLDYGSKASPAHFAVAKKMIQRGIDILVGTRIEYLLLDLGNGYSKNEKQQEQAEDVSYFSENREILRINYLEYFKRQAVLPIDELLFVALKLEGFMKSQLEILIQKSYQLQQIKKINSVKLEFID